MQLPGCCLEAVHLWDVLRVNLGPYTWGTELWKEAIRCPKSVCALTGALSAGVPVVGQQWHGASETLGSPQLMESIAFHLFFFFVFFGMCGGEGKEFTFILYVSQVNKVILGSLPYQQVGVRESMGVYVAEKKQSFLIPLLPWRTLYVYRRIEGSTPPPQHEWLLSQSRHGWASYFWERNFLQHNKPDRSLDIFTFVYCVSCSAWAAALWVLGSASCV